MGAPVYPIWQQADYAFYDDDTESDSTLIGSAGSQQTLDTDTIYQCRLAINETNGANKSPDLTLLWQYNHESGGWSTITGSTPIQFADSIDLTDGESTTNRDPTGTGTFNSGRVYESANTSAVCYTSSGNDHTEALLCFQIDSAQVTDGDEILVRCVEGDGTVFGGTYTNADIDVNEPVTVTGTLSKTLADLTASGDGDVTVTGTTNETLDALTSSSDGSVDIVGTTNETLGDLTSSADASVDVVGTLEVTLDALTLDADGVITTGPTAELDVTLDNLDLAGEADLNVTGTTNETFADVTVLADGVVDIAGTTDETLAALTASSEGVIAIQGEASMTLDSVGISADGSLPVVGESSSTLESVGLVSAVGVDVVADLTKTLEDVLLVSTDASPGRRDLSPRLLKPFGMRGVR